MVVQLVLTLGVEAVQAGCRGAGEVEDLGTADKRALLSCKLLLVIALAGLWAVAGLWAGLMAAGSNGGSDAMFWAGVAGGCGWGVMAVVQVWLTWKMLRTE
jgi:hypothetical protein